MRFSNTPPRQRYPAPLRSLTVPALLAGLVGAALPDIASAQDGASQPAAPADLPAQTDANEDIAGQIIVKGRRWGRAEIEAEAEIGEGEIESFGATTVGELLGIIAPIVDGSGDTPELLVNGKRIANPAEIESYPKEALAGIAILPKEAAAAYGFEQGKRVVNLELKREFTTWNAQAKSELPTAGGRHSSDLTVGRFTIDHDTRWNVGATISGATQLLRNERSLPIRPEIAAIIATLETNQDLIDPDSYEALLPSSNAQSLHANVSHPLGSFTGSLNFAVGRSASVQKTGMPIAVLDLPGDPPDDTNMVSAGFLLPQNALESRQSSRNVSAGASLSGRALGWQTDLSLRYSAIWTKSAQDIAYDTSALQQRIDDGEIPSDLPNSMERLPLLTDRLSTRNQIYGLSFTASNAIATLPAGPARASTSLNVSRYQTRFTVRNAADASPTISDMSTNQLDGLLSLSLPIAGAQAGKRGPIGTLTASVSGAFRKVTGAATNYRTSGAMDWAPIPVLNLRASYSRENAEPTYQQLYGPRVEILNRIFDYSRGEYVQPLFRFGGNTDLEGGKLVSYSAELTAMPFGPNLGTLNVSYRHNAAHGGVMSFPELTPAIEAAFPDRVERNSDGQIIAIDARPINIASESSSRLTSGLSLRWTEQRDPGVGDDAAQASFAPWTITGSISHEWALQSTLQIRPELAQIDRLEGNGQARHSISFQLNGGRRGLGMDLSGTWTGPARVTGVPGGDFHYPASTAFSLGAFVEPGVFIGGTTPPVWLKGLRLSLDIQNIFDSRRILRSDSFPSGLSTDEIDPLGRTIQFSISSQF